MATYIQTDVYQNAADGTGSISFTAAIGAANANRVVVLTWNEGTTSVSGVTFGGTTANLAIVHGGTPGDLSIWYLSVPTGTTTNIVVSAAGTQSAPLGIIGSLITAAPTPTNTYFTAQNTSDPDTLSSVIVPASGVAVAALNANADISSTITWGNATPDINALNPTGGGRVILSGAHTTTTGTFNITASSLGGTLHHMAAAVWGDSVGPTTPPTLGRVGV